MKSILIMRLFVIRPRGSISILISAIEISGGNKNLEEEGMKMVPLLSGMREESIRNNITESFFLLAMLLPENVFIRYDSMTECSLLNIQPPNDLSLFRIFRIETCMTQLVNFTQTP